MRRIKKGLKIVFGVVRCSTMLFFVGFYIIGCGFEDPYVPDSVGSSKIGGRIVTEPTMDLTGTEVLLSGEDSFATIASANGEFRFQNVPPGHYSLQIQKKPYLQGSFPVDIHKATDEDLGELNIKLKGAIAGTIPKDKIGSVRGEVEIIVYVNGIPRIPQRNPSGDFLIDVSSPDNTINIRTVTKITVYIDSVSYYAKIEDNGDFLVEFVPPGIYNDIRLRLNSEDILVLVTNGTVEVKSGQTRFLPS